MSTALRRDPQIVSKAMRRVRSSGTAPERLLRSALWARGARYRLRSRLPGRPDLVFATPRVAVFVDGDFWHGRQWVSRGFASLEEQMSRVNMGEYWISKLQRNVERDRVTDEALTAAGWHVIRLWESDIKKDPDKCADMVVACLKEPHDDIS